MKSVLLPNKNPQKFEKFDQLDDWWGNKYIFNTNYDLYILGDDETKETKIVKESKSEEVKTQNEPKKIKN